MVMVLLGTEHLRISKSVFAVKLYHSAFFYNIVKFVTIPYHTIQYFLFAFPSIKYSYNIYNIEGI